MITNDTIKEELEESLELVEQWKNDPSNYFKYFNKTEMLVELLEVDNCGSIGGFDKGQKIPHGTPYERLKQRAHWVLFGKELKEL